MNRSDNISVRDLVRNHTQNVIRALVKSAYDGNEAYARRTLAHARRGAGKRPGSVPETWEITLKGISPRKRLDEAPAPEEWAVHIAITLFALHQQGKSLKDNLMHQDKQGLGRAIGILSEKAAKTPGEVDAKTKKKFDALATARDIIELERHIRSMVPLLKAESIKLDYGQLSADIYDFHVEERQSQLRLQWGRDFFRGPDANASKGNANNEVDIKEEDQQSITHHLCLDGQRSGGLP